MPERGREAGREALDGFAKIAFCRLLVLLRANTEVRRPADGA